MFKYPRPVILYLLVVSACLSCSEKYFSMGDSWVSPAFRLLMVDSLTVELSTVKIDSVRTQGQNVILVGKYLDINPHVPNDTLTGLTSASSYLTLSLPEAFEPAYNVIFDSITLEMRFNGQYFGDTIPAQNILIYRLTRHVEFEADGAAYNTSSFPTEPTPLAEISFKNQPLTNTAYGAETPGGLPIEPVRARLPDSIGEKLLEMFINKNDTVNNIDRFTEYFKGFALVAGANSKAINGFKVDTTFHMRLHYHKEEDFINRGYVDFTLNASKQFNNITSDRTGTPLYFPPVTNELSSKETKNRAYIQSGDAMYVKLRFPYVNNLMSLGRLGTIEQAVLFIRPVNTTYDYITPLPKSLYLYTESGSSALADSYNQTLNGNLQTDYQFHENTYYSFDITSFLKSQLGTYDNYKNFLILRLSDTDYQNTVQRLVIGDREHTLHFDAGVHGTQTIFSRIELQIFYTIYDDPAN